MVVSRVARLPYIGEPHEKPLKAHEVKITAVPIPEPKPDIVPLWIIILSACIGVLILLLLIYLLYKVSSFEHFIDFFQFEIKIGIFFSFSMVSVWFLQTKSPRHITRTAAA